MHGALPWIIHSRTFPQLPNLTLILRDSLLILANIIYEGLRLVYSSIN